MRVARLLCAAVALTWVGPAFAQLSAGAGKAQVALSPDMLPIDGFTAILDPLHARVLLLDNGGSRVAIAVVDQTSIGGDAVSAYKAIVAAATRADPDNIWIVASHSFSAPHVFGGRGGPIDPATALYKSALDTALHKAAVGAASQLRPARIGFATASSDVNVNRNVPIADGWWLGANDAGPSDKSVGVVRIEDANNRPIAVLLNYAVQSSVMDQTGGNGTGKGVTADLAGAAARHIEEAHGDSSVALFLTGAAGDQAPDYKAVRTVYDQNGKAAVVDLGSKAYPLVTVQGERLGAQALGQQAVMGPAGKALALAVRNGSVMLGAQDRPRSLGQIKPTRTYTYPIKGTAQAPYSLLRIGDIALVGVQAELNAATGLDIKKRSPFARTLIVTMVNGAAKYLPDASNYRDITYQSMNSSYAPGGAEILADRIISDLRKLKSAKAR